MEIWCECFGKPRETIRRSDSYEIEAILSKIGGWERFTGNVEGKKRLALYGPQRVFVRSEQEVQEQIPVLGTAQTVPSVPGRKKCS